MARIGNRAGLTLVECLISMLIIGFLVVAVLGAYYTSRIGTERARHRVTAMNIVQQYMEKELEAGYNGGIGGAEDDVGHGYCTTNDMAPSGTWPKSVTIDDRGTPATTDDLLGTIMPEPAGPYAIHETWSEGVGQEYIYPPGSNIKYKVVGFAVSWDEQTFGTGFPLTCAERAVVRITESYQGS